MVNTAHQGPCSPGRRFGPHIGVCTCEPCVVSVAQNGFPKKSWSCCMCVCVCLSVCVCVSQLSAALAKGTAGIPSQQGLLKHLAQQVHSELGSIADGEYARNVPRCPHVKACLSHLDDLKAVMQLVPNPVTVQYSSQPQVRRMDTHTRTHTHTHRHTLRPSPQDTRTHTHTQRHLHTHAHCLRI